MKINGLKKLTTDVLIIGGGTAGCYAALTINCLLYTSDAADEL